MKKYKSKNVLRALFDGCHQSYYYAFFEGKNPNPKQVVELLILLAEVDREIKFFGNANFNRYAYKNGIIDIQLKSDSEYLEFVRFLVINYDKLSEEQKDYYFGLNKIARDKTEKIAIDSCWTYAYRYFIDYAYDFKKHLFNLLINKIIKANKAYDEDFAEQKRRGWNEGHIKHMMERFCKITILKSTLIKTLQNNDLQTFDLLMATQHETISDYEIKMEKLKANPENSKEFILQESCIDAGIVVIDKILEVNDFEFIQKMLNEHPIHQLELLINLLKANQFREMFQIAVDNKYGELAKLIIKNQKEDIEKHLLVYWKSENCPNKKHLYILENGKKVNLIDPTYDHGWINQSHVNNIEEVTSKLQSVKKRIIDELRLKLDKEKTVGDLTKEYFETELAKGNTDLVIIKLCVRLEAIFRTDFRYEGDFSEMLKKYCDDQLHWDEDDGWGYMVGNCDSKAINTLNNLRLKRNSIVHSDKTEVELSLEDLQYLIDYICKMG